MATLSIARTIHAPTAFVFKTVADPTHFAQAISGVTKIEFLSSMNVASALVSVRLAC